MRRRTRRFNGNWFPAVAEPTFTEIDSVGGTVTVSAQPIIGANTDEPTNTTLWPGGFSLASSQYQGYLVKRIIGSFFCGIARGAAFDGDASTANFFAGICVDRVDSSGAFLNLNAWNPFIEGSTQKRWLWRRSWVFGNPDALNRHRNQDYANWPSCNAEYGSLREGTHIDVKSKARVSYEERLWLVTAVCPTNGGTESVHGFYRTDLRMFGVLTQRGNR